jgi:hypothetical protein
MHEVAVSSYCSKSNPRKIVGLNKRIPEVKKIFHRQEAFWNGYSGAFIPIISALGSADAVESMLKRCQYLARQHKIRSPYRCGLYVTVLHDLVT